MSTPRAVIFDTDGVLLDSAALHAAAWKTAFDGCLDTWPSAGGRQSPFDAEREYRGLPFHDVRPALTRLRNQKVRCAAVSASRHARPLLEAAGLAGLFDALVDGADAGRLGLAGKPDPALFLEAADRLGVAPARAAVVEDARAGVEAGRRGHFGLVVGISRTSAPDAQTQLRVHGADVVFHGLTAVAERVCGAGP